MNKIYNGKTPYIIEERKLNATQLDVFSRLLLDRIIWISGPINDELSDIVQGQLLFLDNHEPNKDITMYINSGGGSVTSGQGIIDTMNYIKSDISTVNIGICASMASVILSSGTKGKRSSLVSSRVMTHTVSSGTQGTIMDNRINLKEAEKANYQLFKILAENTGKEFDEIYNISKRDKWFNSDEALEFGFIDEVIGGKGVITKRMEGFEDYLKKENK